MPSDLAWAAGFFDGEGSTYLNHIHRNSASRRPNGNLRVKIGQSGEDGRVVLERFRAAVGVGVIRGPYKLSGNRQVVFAFDASGDDALRVLEQLDPYLSQPKRYQAVDVITTVALQRGVRTCLA